MASAPQPNLPLFFNDLMPLNSKDHANYRSRPMTKAPWLAKQHAVPLTVDEFVQAQRDMPIVFSTGPEAVPLALMGAWRYYQNPDIDIRLGVVLYLSIGAVVGAFIGAKIAGLLPAYMLRKLFAIFLIVAAMKMLFYTPAKKATPPQPNLQENKEVT